MTQYNIILIGDGGVGKTTFIKKLLHQSFDPKYVATLGLEVHPVNFDDNVFNVWDCAGQEKFRGQGNPEQHYENKRAAIIMFDVGSRLSYTNSLVWYISILEKLGNIPIVFVGNKIDIQDRKVLEADVIIPNNCKYVEISAKNDTNINAPLRYLVDELQTRETKSMCSIN